jgi:hypothetical protein
VARGQTVAGRRSIPGAGDPLRRLAGKKASETTQESIRILKQRGEYDSLRAAVDKSRYGLREQKSTNLCASALEDVAVHYAIFFAIVTDPSVDGDPAVILTAQDQADIVAFMKLLD